MDMDVSILCQLLAVRINPDYFQLRGLDVYWLDGAFDTAENQAVVADVLANYDTLAAAYVARQNIVAQIIELETQQTARRMREAVAGVDNGWLANLEAQIAVLRAQL